MLKNKCTCGRYKNEFDKFCIFCEPNPVTEGYSSCSICKNRKNNNLFYTEPDCPETYCKPCAQNIKSTGIFVCKFCGLIDEHSEFANHYTCIDCYTKRRDRRLKGYRNAKKK